MEPKSRLSGAARPFCLALVALASLILVPGANVFAQTQVYRCIAPDGGIEFSQSPCTDGAEEREVRIEDRKTGWDPSRLKVERIPKVQAKSSARKRKADKEDQAALTRREEKCWKKRQQLEKVNWKLRRGYKPATGVKLRRQRQDYEAYIRQFCK